MGYTTNKNAIRRVKNHLDQMVEASGEIVWSSEEASKLAYYIREAIAVAKNNALDLNKRPQEPYATYARLGSKYIVKVQGTRVIASPRDLLPLPTLRDALPIVQIPQLRDAIEIVGAALTHKAPEMFFPDASLSDPDLEIEQLYNWTSKNGYFIVGGDNGVTLTQKDPGVIAWRP